MKHLEEMDSPSACEAQFDALPQQVAEERQGMVQLHLFIIESQAKCHGAKYIPAKTEAQDPPQGKAQADAVVPGVVKVSNVLSSSHHLIITNNIMKIVLNHAKNCFIVVSLVRIIMLLLVLCK